LQLEEIWRGVIYQGKDLSQYYEVSNKGHLRNTKTKYIVKLHKIKTGYLTYSGSLGSRNSKKIIRIHKCVAETFIDNPNNLPQVHHKDDIKVHNWIENLEWITAQGNAIKAIEDGLCDIRKGERCNFAKLTNQQANEIRELYTTGEYTHRSLGKLFNINHSAITKIVNNQTYIN
jgi:hypothetical protein